MRGVIRMKRKKGTKEMVFLTCQYEKVNNMAIQIFWEEALQLQEIFKRAKKRLGIE